MEYEYGGQQHSVTHSGGEETQPSHEPTIFAEPLFSIGSFSVTNSLLTSWIAVFLLVVLGIAIRKSLREVPGKFQLFFETLWEEALELGDQVTGNRELTERILPISLTIFLFVLVNNWMGILPGVGSIGEIVLHDGHEVFIPYLRGGTADVNTTLALAIISVLGANLFGIVAIGFWKTVNKYINVRALKEMVTKVREDPTLLIVAPITFFVGVIEFIGEVAKVASLSFRLFGNVFAGEVLLAAMASIFAYLVPVPFLFLEILVGVIQALIFAMLTMVYLTIASQDHEHDESDHELQYEVTEEALEESVEEDEIFNEA